MGIQNSSFATCIWRSWAPHECKIFGWLASQHRIWTSDQRARLGLQDHPTPCYNCLQEEDNAEHILIQCIYAREVWFYCLTECNIEALEPSTGNTMMEWWLQARSLFHRAGRRSFDTLFLIMVWALWKQQNTRVFNITQ